VCSAVLFAAGFARAQQVDVAVSGSTLLSTNSSSTSQLYLPPPERGGVYPGGSLEYLLKHRRVGLNAEVAVRYRKAEYNDYQKYRPSFYDVNAVFAPRFGPKIVGDVMAGLGGENIRFQNPSFNCVYASGCATHLSDNHFLVHFGAGIRYYVWRNFFVRPEIHYYRIVNNSLDFYSDNEIRAGVSIGHTWGPR
jgi:opacity protein-like surface antigen